jgi:hypothetical protein
LVGVLGKFLTADIKIITMEGEFLSRGTHVSVYKLSLAKQLEENKKLLEQYEKQKNQQKRIERQKQVPNGFVCDWQQDNDNSM